MKNLLWSRKPNAEKVQYHVALEEVFSRTFQKQEAYVIYGGFSKMGAQNQVMPYTCYCNIGTFCLSSSLCNITTVITVTNPLDTLHVCYD